MGVTGANLDGDWDLASTPRRSPRFPELTSAAIESGLNAGDAVAHGAKVTVSAWVRLDASPHGPSGSRYQVWK